MYRTRVLQSRFCGLADASSDGVYVTLDLCIGEPQRQYSSLNEYVVSFGIIICLVIMDGTVNLNDYLSSVAIEVCDEALNYLLTMKMQTCQTAATQVLPEQAFG